MVRRQERGNTTEGMLQSSSVPLNRELYIEDYADGSRKLKIGDGIHLPKDLPIVNPSLMATNLITNGDYSQGTENLYADDASLISLENNELIFVATKQNGRYSFKNLFKANNKYYVFGQIKASTDAVTLDASGIFFDKHSGNGQYEFLSGIRNFPSTGVFNVGAKDASSDNFQEIGQKYIGVINLNQDFGIGYEPTKEQMDWLMSQFPDNWFDGTKTLIDFKTMIKLLIKGW